MTPEQAFKGGIAVITGAGSGIGAGLARHAARLGMTVVVADILRARAENVAHEIKNAGGKAHAYVVDARDADAVVAMAAWVYKELGDVRLLFNNAGIEILGFTWELTPAQWKGAMDILLNSVYNGIHAFVPRMIESTKRGKRVGIVNTSSLGGVCIAPLMSPYMTAKHAVLALTECLALEMQLTKTPIDVSVILPGPVATNIFNDAVVATGANAAWAEKHRVEMGAFNTAAGKQPDEVAPFIFEQVANGAFWVSTDADDIVVNTTNRGQYLIKRERPTMLPEMVQFYEPPQGGFV
jgi:NAD(P)-dependent dehydrogenase (short-subunit alcohol dehydrogenase family)